MLRYFLFFWRDLSGETYYYGLALFQDLFGRGKAIWVEVHEDQWVIVDPLLLEGLVAALHCVQLALNVDAARIQNHLEGNPAKKVTVDYKYFLFIRFIFA